MNFYKKIVVTLVLLLFFTACSGSEDKNKEETQQQKAEKIGHQAAEDIKGTINSADIARQTAEQHEQKIQEILENEEQNK